MDCRKCRFCCCMVHEKSPVNYADWDSSHFHIASVELTISGRPHTSAPLTTCRETIGEIANSSH